MADQIVPSSKPESGGAGRMIMIVLAGIAICICLAIMTVVGGSVYYVLQQEAATTATYAARSTGTQIAQVTGTVAANATRVAVTEYAQASATAHAQAANATATNSAELVDLYRSGRRLNRLNDVSIRHYPDNSYLETYLLGVTVANFVVEATFDNPDAGDWGYGFVFRSKGNYQDFRLVIDANRDWGIIQIRSQDDYSVIADGVLDSSVINTGMQDHNTLMLVADGKTGMFFLNNILISRLDLSTDLEKGSLALFYDGGTAGKYSQVTNITVWNVP